MEERRTLARPYALAAFEQAQAEGEVAEWSDMLSFLGAAVSDRTLAGIISDPRVNEERLSELLLDLCEGRLSQSRTNFLRLLIENDRVSLAPAIAALFAREQARAEGRARVEVVSAFELGDEHREVLTGAMARRLGREIDLEVSVDPALIGGVIIRSGDVVIDGSLRGRLRQLRNQLS